MDSVTDRLFRHMAWANSHVFDCLSQLSETELLLTAPHDDWTAASILEHLTGAGYADALDGFNILTILLVAHQRFTGNFQ